MFRHAVAWSTLQNRLVVLHADTTFLTCWTHARAWDSGNDSSQMAGPRGIGFLYVSPRIRTQLRPVRIDIHGAVWTAADQFTLVEDAKRFETFECFVAAKIGLGVAVRYALSIGLDNIWRRLQHLATLLRNQLQTVPGIVVTDTGLVKCAIVTFMHQDVNAADINAMCLNHNINVGVVNVTSTRFDMEARGLTSLVRASVHYYNSEQEIALLVNVVRDGCARSRSRL
eukprot:TRINITY_DN6859_c0_g1_i1.p2 TRINITY_DN6859_c0_g1~~TRINITY_DN6859_c0_g1_i1.p2  ORF type:complete len:227 (-),score=50.23 TRINITY_DN6859_c0_g1_i1:1227-1907(-)